MNQFSRNKKADLVEVLARKFVNNLIDTITYPEGCTYYMHILLHHIGDQIRSCPVDIMDASCQSIERVNSIVKKYVR